MTAIGLAGSARTPRPAIVVNFRAFDSGCGNPLICGVIIADTPRLTGHGEHGSFSLAETDNFMAALGPDFKSGYRDQAPASNADIGMTIAHILQLNIASRGKHMGRVLDEVLAGGPGGVKFERQTLQSPPAGGVATVLKTQSVGDTVYLDSASFESAR